MKYIPGKTQLASNTNIEGGGMNGIAAAGTIPIAPYWGVYEGLRQTTPNARRCVSVAVAWRGVTVHYSALLYLGGASLW